MISGRVGVANHMSFIEHVEIDHPYVGTIAARVGVARLRDELARRFQIWKTHALTSHSRLPMNVKMRPAPIPYTGMGTICAPEAYGI